MVLAVEERRFHVHHRIAGQHPGLHCFLDAFFNGRDEIPRNRTALGLVAELESGTLRQRFDPDLDDSELPMTARLPHETAFGFGRTPNRLAIRNLRLPNVRIDLKLAEHPVDDYLEVQLAHS